MDANDYDWVVISPRPDAVLHAPMLSPGERAQVNEEGFLSCGATMCSRTTEHTYIPGMFTRMQGKRCDRCSDTMGFPRGVGSPKNDPGCAQRLAERAATPRMTQAQYLAELRASVHVSQV